MPNWLCQIAIFFHGFKFYLKFPVIFSEAAKRADKNFHGILTLYSHKDRSTSLKTKRFQMKRFIPYIHYLKPVLFLFITGILLGSFHGILSGFGLPFMINKVFPKIFSVQGEAMPAMMLFLYCAMPPVVFFFRGVCGFFNTLFMAYCGTQVLEAIRLDVFRKIQCHQMEFFSKNNTGDLIARISGDTAILQQVLTGVSNDIIKQPITFFGAIGALVYLSIKYEEAIFILFCLSSIPACIFPIRYIGKRILKRTRQNAKFGGTLINILTENLVGIKEVRAFCLEEEQVNKLHSLLKKMIQIQMKLVRYSNSLSPSIEIISATGISVTLYFAYRKGIKLDVFLPLLSALYFSYSPIKSIGKIHHRIKNGQASLERLQYIMTMPITVEDPVQPRNVDRIHGNISFKDVSFSYGNVAALRNINFNIPSGSTVALVGPSGAGKTTVTNLLMRFYDVDSGSIAVDNMDVKALRKSDLRKNIALVPQDPFLFNESVYYNIHIGNVEATEEMVYEASKKAYAHEFIEKLPDGYKSNVGDRGSSLSGGQRQRIAVARAFLRKAPILILDEATSALDSESESMIQQALEVLVENKTVFIIAHRFSTIRLAERILTFDNGQLVAEGDHDELYETCLVYKTLYDHQAATTPNTI